VSTVQVARTSRRVRLVADRRPGLNPPRLLNLMRLAVRRLELDLGGRTVVTEAATGAYGVTPVLAGLAGARRVWALARDSRYGSAEQAGSHIRLLATFAGVEDRVELVSSKADIGLAEADLVTNSGHLRPLDVSTIRRMKPGAAISLMYEAWELRAEDIDLGACRECGIHVGGTNERHPAVDGFAFLGAMAVKLLSDAGVCAYGSRLLLLCDNPFRGFIERELRAAGAELEVRRRLAAAPIDPALDAVVVALRPRSGPVLDAADGETLAELAPGAVVVQFWGDLDRDGLLASGVPVWPELTPQPGHMAVLPSAVGPEPIVRIQAAGLKVGQVLCKDERQRTPADIAYVQWV
jgi:hypothetical protein